ncbi:hypothetical protein psyc5s11_25230 [Clostridium gelidum]|uniref:Uncharacterized protein n=1 Tax=Clostridium gelidum TaxID=704125 RepID=A0ABN6J0H2_9CLOT|nr:hypothetical protein psyc5s11_25230 [Clostridium gelidum]
MKRWCMLILFLNGNEIVMFLYRYNVKNGKLINLEKNYIEYYAISMKGLKVYEDN